MTQEEIVRWVIAGLGALLEIATQMGHRDAALSAMDATLALARVKDDADLTAKHRLPQP